MNWKTGLSIAVAVVLIGMLVVLTGPKKASLLLINGKIYQGDGTPWTVEALAVRDGKIAALGTTQEITRRYDADRVIDLRGRSAYPGFTDAHGHIESLGAGLLNLDLAGTSSPGEIRRRLEEWKKQLKPGQWIRGRGWDQNDWPEKKFPHHRDLDDVAGDVPVVLSRVDGHAVGRGAVVGQFGQKAGHEQPRAAVPSLRPRAANAAVAPGRAAAGRSSASRRRCRAWRGPAAAGAARSCG